MIVDSWDAAKAAVPSLAGLKDEDLLGLVKPAELRMIRPVLGPELYEYLDGLSSPTGTALEVIESLQRSVVHYALAMSGPSYIVLFDQRALQDAGNSVPQWKYREAIRAWIETADAELELALETLELKRDEFVEWTDSDAFAARMALFVRNGRQLGEAVPSLTQTRRAYVALMPFLSQAEQFYLKPLLGSAFYASLKTELASATVSDLSCQIIKRARPCVALEAALRSLSTLRVVLQGGTMKVLSQGITSDGSIAAVPATLAELEPLVASWKSSQAEYAGDLLGYLREHAADYPLYQVPDTNQPPPGGAVFGTTTYLI